MSIDNLPAWADLLASILLVVGRPADADRIGGPAQAPQPVCADTCANAGQYARPGLRAAGVDAGCLDTCGAAGIPGGADHAVRGSDVSGNDHAAHARRNIPQAHRHQQEGGGSAAHLSRGVHALPLKSRTKKYFSRSCSFSIRSGHAVSSAAGRSTGADGATAVKTGPFQGPPLRIMHVCEHAPRKAGTGGRPIKL